MLVKYEELSVELTAQVGLLYHHLNFSYCFLYKWDGITYRHMIQTLDATNRPFTGQGHKVSKLHLDPANTIIQKFLGRYIWGEWLTSISTDRRWDSSYWNDFYKCSNLTRIHKLHVHKLHYQCNITGSLHHISKISPSINKIRHKFQLLTIDIHSLICAYSSNALKIITHSGIVSWHRMHQNIVFSKHAMQFLTNIWIWL